MQPYVIQNVGLSSEHIGKRWIYVGLDLGERDWVVLWMKLWVVEDLHARKPKKFSGAGRFAALLAWLLSLKVEFACDVHVLYEAGRQGFELARKLMEEKIHVDIVAVSRLDLAKRRKRGKSDGLDALRLTVMDWTVKGFPKVWIPSREQEGLRNLLMWEDGLERDLRRCRNQGLSILSRWGVEYKTGLTDGQYRKLVRGLAPHVVGDVDGLRLEGLWCQEAFLRKELKRVRCLARKRLADDAVAQKIQVWKGVGEKTARILSWYVGEWGRFGCGRSFGAYCGLTSVHVQSGTQDSDVGVSRAGHRLLRCCLGRQALLWLKHQRECGLVKNLLGLQEQKGKRSRVVRSALARQLAVALWDWVVTGKEIEGALKK